MALDENEAEIPLNGGIDTKTSDEFQGANSMRSVVDLRLNSIGEYERRPGWDAATSKVVAIPDSSDYPLAIGGRNSASAIIKHKRHPLVLSENHGLYKYTDRYTTGPAATGALDPISRPTAYSAPESSQQPGYAPIGVSVSRRTIATADDSELSTGVYGTASAEYGDVTVAAWILRTGATFEIRARAINAETGAPVCDERSITFTSAAGSTTIRSCSLTESGSEGVLIAYTHGTGSPLEIRGLRWDAATNEFLYLGAIVTTSASFGFDLHSYNSLYYLSYDDTVSVSLIVLRRTIAGGTIATHTATHRGDAGSSITDDETDNVLIASADGFGGFANSVYAEIFGEPATATTLLTCGATEAAVGPSIALEEDDLGNFSAVVSFGMFDSTYGSGGGFWSRALFCTYTATTVALASTFDIPAAMPVGSVRVNGRVYLALTPILSFGDLPIRTAVVGRFTHESTNNLNSITPVALVGYDRVVSVNSLNLQPADMRALGNDIIMTYSGDLGRDVEGQSIFETRLNFDQRPVPHCESQGLTLFGGGMVHAYDGKSPTEHQAHHTPGVTYAITGAGSLTGVFGFAAVWRWVDAAGNLHRSSPGFVTTGSRLNEAIDVYVTRPIISGLDGASDRVMGCDLYVTEAGGSNYYLAKSGGPVDRFDSVDNTFYIFNNVAAGVSTDPLLYTTGAGGQPIPSSAPPSCHSMANITDRVWLLDSEDRTRVWFSKPLVAGFAPEFSVRNTLFVGDECVAITDMNGAPTILGKSGIWQIYGPGPSANGVGGFAPPRRLPHEVECLDPLSVCKTPAGIFFRGRRGMYLLDTGLQLQPVGLAIDPEVRVSGKPTGYCKSVYDELSSEVHVFDYSKHFVYNLTEKKWTEYSRDEDEQQWKDATVIDGKVWHIHEGPSNDISIRRALSLDDASHDSTSGTWSIKTPWLKLGGDITHDVRLWRLLLAVKLPDSVANAGNLTMVVETPRGTSETFTWTPANLDDASSAEGEVTVLSAPISNQRARTYKVTISGAASISPTAAVIPVALRARFGIAPRGRRVQHGSLVKGST